MWISCFGVRSSGPKNNLRFAVRNRVCISCFCIFGKSNQLEMDKFYLRLAALVLHAAANFLLITWLTNFDISGSWLAAAGFVTLLAALLALFIWHILSFLFYIKNKIK